MTVKPLGERVLIEVKGSEEKTAGGLVIPTAAQEKTMEGTIIAVGDADGIKLKVGDKVIYDKYAGTQIKIEGKDHILIKAEEVLAVIC